MNIDPKKPYNDLPELPPNANLETPSIFRAAINANKALAELKGLAETIPNQSIFVNTISLKEAQYSSEVENIITTTDELYQAYSLSNQNITQSTKEVLRYSSAMWKGYALLKKSNLITTNIINEIQVELLENNAGIRTLSGTALKNNASGKIIYTPPVGEKVIRDQLKNLEVFINEENNIDPLIKLAIIHHQFEAIHPFYDGNGRTGRILNVLYLTHQNLLNQPILYLSHYIIQNKERYYNLLRDVTFNQRYEPWILYMLDCIEVSAKESILKIQNIQKLMNQTAQHIKLSSPKIYSRELMDVLFQQPYCKIKFLEEHGIAKRKTASEYLYQLEKISILSSKKIGRETLFLNKKLFELFNK
ncbi:Fic family protein [Thermoproteota archaeon]